MKKAILFVAAAIAMVFVSCSMFSEGDVVPPKDGIVGLWQSDQNPALKMKYSKDGTGSYKDDDKGQELTFKYSFIDDDTVKTEFPNGNSMQYDVKTTTKYLWMTDEKGTNRLHKME